MEVDPLFHFDIIGPAEAITPLIANAALSHVRPSISHAFGEKSPVSTKMSRRKQVSRTGTDFGSSGGATEARSKEVVIEKGDYLVPLEVAEECADGSEIRSDWLL